MKVPTSPSMKEKNATREKLLDITFEQVYMHGYAATSIGNILSIAKVPKGSMYHFFDSKKSLVLAMIRERLKPKMDLFFNYDKHPNLSVTQSLTQTFTAMAKNTHLITHGCPLYRLMVELSSTDEEFNTSLLNLYEDMFNGLSSLLQAGIDTQEFDTRLDPGIFAEFVISSVWGVLSLSPSISSPKRFIQHIRYILSLLESYKIN